MIVLPKSKGIGGLGPIFMKEYIDRINDVFSEMLD